MSLPLSPGSSEPRYVPCCEPLRTFAPPVRRVSANMHAALVLRLHLGWMDERECLVSSFNGSRTHGSSVVFRITLSVAQAV